MIISLSEYARRNGRAEITARKKAAAGLFITAYKTGGQWMIDEAESWKDNRKTKNERGNRL